MCSSFGCHALYKAEEIYVMTTLVHSETHFIHDKLLNKNIPYLKVKQNTFRIIAKNLEIKFLCNRITTTAKASLAQSFLKIVILISKILFMFNFVFSKLFYFIPLRLSPTLFFSAHINFLVDNFYCCIGVIDCSGLDQCHF